MMTKVVVLFLVFMGVLAMFGKLHWLGGKRLSQKKCSCGRYKIGKSSCSCGQDKL